MLYNYDNVYISSVASMVANLKKKRGPSSLYDKDSILFSLPSCIIDQFIDIILNLELPSMWFNVGYWKNIDPIDPLHNSFNLACQGLVNLLCDSIYLSNGDTILGKNFLILM